MRATSRFTSRSLVAIALAFATACADEGDPAQPDDLGQAGESAQNSDEEPAGDVTVSPVSQATPDAGVGTSLGAQSDAGAPGPIPDAGREVPARDAGNARADVGDSERDASVRPDAAATRDAGSTADACSTLTYANFGMQFMATYCVGCHSGANAKHGVQLDTLAGVQKSKSGVKRQTVTGTGMPSVDPKPSAADRKKLGEWLDCGAN